MSNEDKELKNSSENKENCKWYVIHTYSGYENNVKENIEKIIENRNMYDLIPQVVVPIQEMIEVTKSGQKRAVQRKIFPGYVFLKMVMNDDTWYVVRNTRGVTSFVGPGSKPVPLTEDEVLSMGIENFAKAFNINIGDTITITEGAFENSVGVVTKIDKENEIVVLNVDFFGRETPVEIEFSKIKPIK